jgi:hypothetical protein
LHDVADFEHSGVKTFRTALSVIMDARLRDYKEEGAAESNSRAEGSYPLML